MKNIDSNKKKFDNYEMNSKDVYFLDCEWDDLIWTFKPTNVLEERKPCRINWDFELSNGDLFSSLIHENLLKSSKQLIYIIRGNSLDGLTQRATTTVGYFFYLRELIRFMVDSGYTQFSQLNSEAILQFKLRLSLRPGVGRKNLASSTVQKYLYIFIFLFRFKDKLDDGLSFHPFPGSNPGRSAKIRESDVHRWPYTPDIVAVPLVKGSIEFVTKESEPILQALSVYKGAIKQAKMRNIGSDAANNAANKALRVAAIKIPFSEKIIGSVGQLAHIINMLYAACFVTISYLVGARASEILHLQAGCIKYIGDENSSVAVIVGAVYKRQREYHGRAHEWVAASAATKAISLLEALSYRHRLHTGRKDLWLRRRGNSSANEWQEDCGGDFEVPTTHTIRAYMQSLACWLGVPKFENKVWRLSTHQGRKTFVRFAALRDRSSLFAVAQQLGHRERAISDHGYSGRDYRLQNEIDAEVLENSTTAWEAMLASDGLAGIAGIEIEATRPRFKGERMKLEIKAYARMLVDAGLTLGVCDWGYCVYREKSSACLGNAAGPNPIRREPSTCARCSNFAVTEQHRPYWVGQSNRHSDMLNNTALPKQTLNIVRSRLNEAQLIIRKLDQDLNRSGNE